MMTLASSRAASACPRSSSSARPSRPLARPLRFKKEEREQQERQDKELEEARAKRDAAKEELAKALSNAKGAVEQAAASTTTKSPSTKLPPIPETALVKSIPFFVPAYTRFKEVAVGRVSMLAMAATAALEIARPDHPGPLGQTSQNLGLPFPTVEMLLGAFVLHGLLGLWPTSATYSNANARDFLRRRPGPPSAPANPLTQPARFLGVAPFQWGFLKRNELLHGRVAALAFLASAALEVKTGGLGPVGQLALWLGKAGVDVGGAVAGGLAPALPADGWYDGAGKALVAWAAFCLAVAWARGRMGEVEGGDDVY